MCESVFLNTGPWYTHLSERTPRGSWYMKLFRTNKVTVYDKGCNLLDKVGSRIFSNIFVGLKEEFAMSPSIESISKYLVMVNVEVQLNYK